MIYTFVVNLPEQTVLFFVFNNRFYTYLGMFIWILKYLEMVKTPIKTWKKFNDKALLIVLYSNARGFFKKNKAKGEMVLKELGKMTQ